MEEILELLRKYNERHPEYHGLVGISIEYDGSGYLTGAALREIRGTDFYSVLQLKTMLEVG